MNPVIVDLKRRYKDIISYAEIMKGIQSTDISENKDLQRTFNAFYRVRRNDGWRQEYYGLFEECKNEKMLSFEFILREMYYRTGRIEASFSSKMLASLDPQMPIWDSIVLSRLGYKPKAYGDKEERLAECVAIYDDIVRWYSEFLKGEKAKGWLKEFDKEFPEFQELSDIKKIDFILWGSQDNPLNT